MLIKEDAQRLAAEKIAVFPLGPRQKKPISGALTYKNATTDPTQIDKWWTQYPEANIGVQPGRSGLIVLDIDPKNGGVQSLEKLEEEIQTNLTSRSVRTGSGGLHFYYRLPEGMGPVPNHIGIRDGIDLICEKNHVVGPGSIHPNGGSYEWVDESAEIEEAPDWLIKLVDKTRRPITQLPSANIPGLKGRLANSTKQFLEEGAPDGQWNQTLYKAARDFLQQGYSESEFLEQAEQITGHLDHNDRLTIRSAFMKPPAHGPRLSSADPLRESLKKCKFIRNISNDREFRFVEIATGRVEDCTLGAAESVFKPKEWKKYLAEQSVLARWVYNPRQLEPLAVEPSTGIHIFNQYEPPHWLRAAFYDKKPLQEGGPIPPEYMAFFEHLTAGDRASCEYLLDWMAQSLRGRNFTILCALGIQGAGKGVLSEILAALHGQANFCETSDIIFKKEFNSAIRNKTLVYVDEIALTTKEECDKLKTVVNPHIVIEAKGVDQITARNHASFYISSNHFDAIQIEAGDRRFSIIQVTNTKMTERADLIRWVEEGRHTSTESIEKLARALMGRQLTHRMNVPFQSARTEEVRKAGLADWELYLVEDLADKYAGGEPTLSTIQEELVEAVGLKRGPSRRKVEALAARFPETFLVTFNAQKKRVVKFPKKSA